MTKDELQAKREVALSELKNIEVALCLDEHYIDIIEKENAELKRRLDNLFNSDCWASERLTKAKEIMNIAIEGIKHWGIVGGTERPFEKQAELEFNLFLEKAEQFLKEIEK